MTKIWLICQSIYIHVIINAFSIRNKFYFLHTDNLFHHHSIILLDMSQYHSIHAQHLCKLQILYPFSAVQIIYRQSIPSFNLKYG
jgi:hypothetical protein